MKKPATITFLLICFFIVNAFSVTTNFAGLGASDSGGSGFKTITNNANIIVSNDMANDGTAMYNPNHSAFTLKVTGIEAFKFESMTIQAFVNTTVDVSSTVTFKDKNGTTLQTMTLNADKVMTTTATNLEDFFDNGTTVPIDNVAEIVFDLGTPVQGYTANYNYNDITFTDASLPVELTSFSAQPANNTIKLEWATATEVDNYGFDVERASTLLGDQNNWTKIGFVKGHGNSSTSNQYVFTDQNCDDTGSYSYRLKQIDLDGSFTYSKTIGVDLDKPAEFELAQNYPNPFNPTTTISYSVAHEGLVTLKVFDILGKNVATLVNQNQSAGSYSIEFNAEQLSAGVFFYKLTAGRQTSIKKLTLIK